ncbi:YjbF family lipoprotein [Lentibacter algarum]|uniref:YjbF family lipoprotein n=1 Tax=Lentibacter algarum TaxID=576131 RepID=UPI001C0679D5|nr:YjbF family lipoprotein [Lentibacter algarum]MBU2981216.1 YjbF family lipoprotein [Lentibacter algarum]
MRHLPGILALCALTLTVACGNQVDRGTALKSVGKKVFRGSKASASAAPSQAQLAESINAALSASNKPLTVAVIENRNGFAVLTQVASNNGYQTWGSADKRAISTKSGMVTATRGLGFDLMSAKIDGSLAAVRARRSGASKRYLNFLDGENRVVTHAFNCTITVGASQNIAIGEVSSRVTAVSETCSGVLEGPGYENTYQVSPSGHILQSRQWLGPQTGYVFLQALRQ